MSNTPAPTPTPAPAPQPTPTPTSETKPKESWLSKLVSKLRKGPPPQPPQAR